MKKAHIDIIVITITLPIFYVIFAHLDVLEAIVELSRQYEEYEIDELVSTGMILIFLLIVFSLRRMKELKNLNESLQKSIEEIKKLRGIIPICSYCHKIRNEEGSWDQLEAYICSHSSAEFSHGICPECFEKERINLKK